MPDPFPILPIIDAPFVHAAADDWLDDDLYRALARSFPECPPASGPTGFTLFAGDPAHDRLMAGNPAWSALCARFHTQGFVDYCIRQFAGTFANEATVDLARARYVAYRESREDKERAQLARVEHAPDALWIRFDIMQGRVGYTRQPHLDHRRRVISLLLYLSDADEDGMQGGDLILHGANGAEKLVRPKHNRMVIFPCHNGSLHSVSPIVAQERPRNFVQVTLSSSVDLWPAPSAWRQRLSRLPRKLARAVGA